MTLKQLIITIYMILFYSTLSYAEWYNGGNLHRATVAQWRMAPYANRLATSADWFAGITKAHNMELQRKMAELPLPEYLKQLKLSATKLEICVSDTTALVPGYKDLFNPNDSIAEVAATCYGSIFGFK